MTIDKQALREAAEKAGKDKWQAKKINGDFYVIRSGSYIKQCGITSFQPIAEIDHKPVRDFVAMVNPATTLALLDENLQLQREKDAIEAVALALRDDMRQAREQLEAAERSIAEQSAIVAAAEKLVRCDNDLCSEQNYRALAALFGVNTPDLPPMDGESRTVMMPEPFKMAKSSSGLMYYYADEVDEALAAAGIKVKES
ncbi:ead/Ea22-like family protein [Salmonella enterica subsp. enterica]|nr:ead/Ea22-like family protein [Salmonella enterica]ECC3376329.1 ead/Ea22-like family protein [Salmonella enterica subsp. enterica]EDW3835565.1 ead/Ea22-like family protein [Salmonella enterica subsp. enterica]